MGFFQRTGGLENGTRLGQNQRVPSFSRPVIEGAAGPPGTATRGARHKVSRQQRLPAARLRRPTRLLVARWALVICQAATVVVTWRLWEVRTSPPMLPAFGVPQVAVGLPLLISLLLVLRFPFAGAVTHSVIVIYASIADQTRMQPEVMSMTLLLIAVSGRDWLLFLGRMHLLTLWGWAGVAKLVSPEFMTDTGGWMFDGLFFQPPGAFRPYFGAVVIFFEMGAGLLGFFRDLRIFSAALAVMVHAGALLILGPWGRDWNSAIWPWNVALAVCAITLIAPWKEDWKTQLRSVPVAARGFAVVLVLSPILFYFGLADAYLTHHLYSSDTARGVVCNEEERCSSEPLRASWYKLNAPLPPEPRLFRALFEETCRPGEVLRIGQNRIGSGKPSVTLPCPSRPSPDRES